VVLSAVVGFLVLGEALSGWGILAILLGLAGLMLLSDSPGGDGVFLRRIFNRASGLGLLAGMSFAVSAVAYRGATLAVVSDDFALRAGITLAVVTLFQSVVMALWLVMREPGEIGRVIAARRIGVLVGLSSMIGSLCWFAAFTLQTAAYVKGLGQIELVFSFIASYFFYREKITLRELAGTVILMVSILVLVLVI
jgi:drug/metabolite transporter (DMT)-like permease